MAALDTVVGAPKAKPVAGAPREMGAAGLGGAVVQAGVPKLNPLSG